MVAAFRAAGTFTQNAGAITPPLPAGIVADDILLLFLSTANQVISIADAAGGTWTEIPDSPQSQGSAGAAGGNRLTIFWSRYNGTQTAPVTTDSGNVNIGQILAYSGCITSGTPSDVTAGDTQAATTAGSIPGDTTTIDGCMVVAAASTDFDGATVDTNASGWTNASLASITERADQTTGTGTGGGLAIADGIKTTAGAVSATTWTQTNSANLCNIMIALKPADSAVTGTVAVTQQNQTAAISGTVANPITGTIGVTQGDQTAAFIGTLGISGTIASTQQDQTATFTGSATGADWDCGDWDPLDWATDCAPVGVIASIQDNQTAVFTGTVANPITGTIGVTQQDQTAAFLGTTVSDGVISSIQQDQTGAFTGTVANPVTGTIGVTQANQTGAFTGTVGIPAVTGTIGVTQQHQVAVFVGQSVSTAVTGTIASTQANQTMAASGVVAMAVVGTIAVTQQDQTAAFAGAVANPSDTLVVSVSCTIGGPSVTCTISPEMAVVGSDVYITTNYTNAAGQPANPASVTAVVEAPDGTQTTPTPTSITLGEWTTIIPTDQHGFWFFEITGQGDTVNVVCKGSFCVERSLVSV